MIENIYALGWGLLALIGVGGISHLVKTWAWRFVFEEKHRTVPFIRMVAIRLAGEGVSQLTFAGQVFGETTRALMLRSVVPMVNGISSVVLDRGMYTLTGLLLIVVGAGLSLLTLGFSGEMRAYHIALTLGVGGVAALVVVAIRKRWRLLSAGLQAMRRIGVMKAWVESKGESVEEIETIIYSFYHRGPVAFWSSLGLNLVGHGLGILEVYLVLWLLGVKVTLLAAFFIEVLTKIVKIGGAVVPGNIGTYEGGNMIILKTLGMGSAAGLTLGIARRIRGLFWAGVGLVVLSVDGFQGRPPLALKELEETLATPLESEVKECVG